MDSYALLEFMKEKGFISEKQYKDCSSVEGDPCEYALKRRYITRKKYETILESFQQKNSPKTQTPTPQVLAPESEDDFSDLDQAIVSPPTKSTKTTKSNPSKLSPTKPTSKVIKPDSSVFPSQKEKNEESSNSFSSEIFFDAVKENPVSLKKGEVSGSLSVEIVSNIRENAFPNSKNAKEMVPTEDSADLLEELGDFEMEDFGDLEPSFPEKNSPPEEEAFAEILESDDLIEALPAEPEDSTAFAEILESDDQIEALPAEPEDSTAFAEILESDDLIEALPEALQETDEEVLGSEDDHLVQNFSNEIFKEGFSSGDKGFTSNESLEFEFLGSDSSLAPVEEKSAPAPNATKKTTPPPISPEDTAEFGIIEETDEAPSNLNEIAEVSHTKKGASQKKPLPNEPVDDFFGSDEIDLEITSSNAFLDPLSGDSNPTLPPESAKKGSPAPPSTNAPKNKTREATPLPEPVSSEIATFTDFDSINLSEINAANSKEASEEIIDAPVVSEEEVARRRAKGMKIFEGEYVDEENEPDAPESNIHLDGDSSVPEPLPVSKTSPFVETIPDTIEEGFEEANDFSFLDEIASGNPSSAKTSASGDTGPDLNLDDLDEMDFGNFGNVGDIEAAIDELETLADVAPTPSGKNKSSAPKILQETSPSKKENAPLPKSKKTPSAISKKTPSAISKKTPSTPISKKDPVSAVPFEADPTTGSLDNFLEGLDLELPSPEEDFPSFDDFENEN